MQATDRIGRGCPSVEAARREDAAGCGAWVNPSLAAQLGLVTGDGRRLPPRLAALFEGELACDLGRVRLHVGREVDRLAARLRARAFCVGTDVFLGFMGGAAWHEDGRGLDLDVLRHELAHVAYRTEPERIRFWGGDVHADLTEKTCTEFSRELDRLLEIPNLSIAKADLIKGLKIASSNMDFRKRVWHPLDTAKYAIFNLAFWVADQFGAHFTEGEGPRHGEGLNYSTTDWARNEAKNREEQTARIDNAVEWFKFDREHQIDDKIPTARIGAVALMEKEWVKSLADALHVAQDRASHREGVKLYGHDDLRTLGGWSPDEPMHDHRRGNSWQGCNMAALTKGLNNSYEVFAEFLRKLEIGIAPHRPEMKEPTCSSGFEMAKVYYSPYPNPENKSAQGRSATPCGYVGNTYVRLWGMGSGRR